MDARNYTKIVQIAANITRANDVRRVRLRRVFLDEFLGVGVQLSSVKPTLKGKHFELTPKRVSFGAVAWRRTSMVVAL